MCNKWVKIKEEAEENNKTAYKLILKHCDPSMKMKLELTANFQQIEEKQDGTEFLKLLHSIYFQHDGAKQNIMELVKLKKNYSLYIRQRTSLSTRTQETSRHYSKPQRKAE